MLDGRGRSLRRFSTGGGVLEVRLARLAESVFDPTGGLAQLVQTAETFGISLRAWGEPVFLLTEVLRA